MVDPWPSGRFQIQGAEGVTSEAYKHTPQGETTEGNAVDDILMADQGVGFYLGKSGETLYISGEANIFIEQ